MPKGGIMVIDELANYKDYCTKGSLLEKGFEFLVNTYKPGMADERLEIDGDNCFALLQSYNSVPTTEKRFESHVQYIDIQFVGSGREIVEYLPVKNLEEEENQMPRSDVIFYKSKKGLDLVLKSGHFAIFFPQDGHKPGVVFEYPQEIKKVVVKVKY
jgi:YhcH/YjgK/YiaL family protein